LEHSRTPEWLAGAGGIRTSAWWNQNPLTFLQGITRPRRRRLDARGAFDDRVRDAPK
jgi:hypothetical protein